MDITPAHFKHVLGHFPTGVTVICATGPDGPVGFTCQSFTALSLTPPLVLFAADHGSSSWPLIREAGTVGISILRFDHAALARTFATSGVNKFDNVPLLAGSTVPLIEGAVAHVVGVITAVVPGGDHDIAIVSLTEATTFPGEPLVYVRGGFERLQNENGTEGED